METSNHSKKSRFVEWRFAFIIGLVMLVCTVLMNRRLTAYIMGSVLQGMREPTVELILGKGDIKSYEWPDTLDVSYSTKGIIIEYRSDVLHSIRVAR
ncbi:MAG: hypothetical protein FLDDKLPJ_03306 [Phycisphaerae bacterium]|nr:hypothetical protein [Phycisphaerae bacterium]